MAAQSACRRPPPPLLWGGAGAGAGAGARQPPAPHRTEPSRAAPSRVGRSAGARRHRAGLRQGGARELWSRSDRGVGQSRAEGPWSGAGPRLSAVQLGQAGWKGAGCWRGEGLPPPPSSQSIPGCDPAALPPESHREMGYHGSPSQKRPGSAVCFSRLARIPGRNKPQGFLSKQLRQRLEPFPAGAAPR
ncbi:PREDICTED: formin-like protein 18 [Pseudopodoces humilis]|uniref:formin-like protein 18 n=1 Tax=Pseudopodoces humilis TaxID=181119 RepID=UPI0003958F03|nr:PREDICTED: formin-like protein 18 [Pseudopodoces humilis]